MSHCSECVSLLSDRRVGEKAQVLSVFSAVSNLYLGIVIFHKKNAFCVWPWSRSSINRKVGGSTAGC